ncbi:MAG: hypothetical protein HY048_02550 [Acidobacteria bacterium]|nr:hypothetical protein [Acidobacteriota bacterium]
MISRRPTQNSQNTRCHLFSAGSAVSALCVVLLCAACGKKGPPLPPLVKLPTPPAEFSAERRAGTVEFRFIVPAANTDGTRPANVTRVDVYALPPPAEPDPLAAPGPVVPPPPLTVDEILKSATKVASVAVKAPRDPNATIEPDDPDSDLDAPEGRGLDQGVAARVSDDLVSELLAPVAAKRTKAPKLTARWSPDEDAPRPLLSPRWITPARTYVAVGVTTRGRPGPLSARVAVPLLDPPEPPDSAEFSYAETAIAVTWTPVSPRAAIQDPVAEDEDTLPSRPVGVELPTIAYNVYDAASDLRLTPAPIPTAEFSDARIAWNEERCYAVRAVETLNGLSIESEAAFTSCETLVDTFPPKAPRGLDAVPGEGWISLIWEPNTEKDLAGYIVLRGSAPGDELEPITPAPIQETFFKDAVAAGATYVYAVKAVDAAGNASELSNRRQESARD